MKRIIILENEESWITRIKEQLYKVLDRNLYQTTVFDSIRDEVYVKANSKNTFLIIIDLFLDHHTFDKEHIIKFLNIIRDSRRSLPIIVITGFGHLADFEELNSIGIEHIFVKQDFDHEKFKSIVKQLAKNGEPKKKKHRKRKIKIKKVGNLEVIMGDIFKAKNPGIFGKNVNIGDVNQYQQKIELLKDVNLDELKNDLNKLNEKIKNNKIQINKNDKKTIEQAEKEAEKDNWLKVLNLLSKISKKSLGTVKDVGVDVVSKTISNLIQN